MASKRAPLSDSDSEDRAPKRRRLRSHAIPSEPCYLERLSLEVLCKLMQYLPLRDVMKLDTLSRRLREAVSLHLKLLKTLELSEANILGPMPSGITDYNLESLVNRCPNLETIQGLFTGTRRISKEKSDCALSVDGIIEILTSCRKVKSVELDNPYVLEAVLKKLPQLRILGSFINHGGGFPINDDSFSLSKNPKVRYLHLTGVTVPELPCMDSIIYLYLRFVKFTNTNPFSHFIAPNLHTFVMSNCAGPANALKYVPLVTRLAASRALRRLELVRVPFLGGLFQHVLEDTWKFGGFSSVENITFGACKHATEVDLGHLILTCAQKLFQLVVQPSLTKDNMFLALSMAEATFPRIETLYLGYTDPFPEQGRWTNADLVNQGLSDVVEHPALITDVGVQLAGKMFSNLRNLIAYNCPYLRDPTKWLVEDGTNFAHLRYLHLHRCHSIKMIELSLFLADLPCLESVYLQEMFKEPPKGCGHVGLSAGTALGVSAAFLANQDGAPPAESLPEPVDPLPADDPQPPAGRSPDLPPVGQVAMDVANAAGLACGHPKLEVPSSSGQKNEVPDPIDPKDRILVEEIDALLEEEEESKNEDKVKKKEVDETKKYEGKGKRPISGRFAAKGKKKESPEASTSCGTSTEPEPGPSTEEGATKSAPKDDAFEEGMTKDTPDEPKPGTSSDLTPNKVETKDETESKEEDSEEKEKDTKEEDSDDSSPKRTIGTQTTKAREEADSDSEQSDGEERHPACAACDSGPAHRPPLPVYRINRPGQQLADIPQLPRSLPIRSSCLISMTLFMVGVEELVLDNCSQLTTLHVTACRVLKSVSLKECVELYRVTVAQCPVFNNHQLLTEIVKLRPIKSRLLFLRPMYKMDICEVEKTLFAPDTGYHGYLVRDHSLEPSTTIHNKPRFEETVKLFSMINKSVLKDWSYKKKNADQDEKEMKKFPWQRQLATRTGQSEDGSSWDVVTDVPWFHTLYGTDPDESSLTFTLGQAEFRRGIYSPKYHNHTVLANAMKTLEYDIADLVGNGEQAVYPYVASVYVNTCDVSGIPTSDMYV